MVIKFFKDLHLENFLGANLNSIFYDQGFCDINLQDITLRCFQQLALSFEMDNNYINFKIAINKGSLKFEVDESKYLKFDNTKYHTGINRKKYPNAIAGQNLRGTLKKIMLILEKEKIISVLFEMDKGYSLVVESYDSSDEYLQLSMKKREDLDEYSFNILINNNLDLSNRVEFP